MAEGSLHQDVGHLEGKLESLEGAVEKLSGKVERLTSALDQATGAKVAIFAIPAIISVVASIATFFGMWWTFLRGN